jgi:tetratricopeptide (TPR) repeat protein
MALLLLGCLCWLTICFNYYYVPALLLLPGLARENRRLAAQLVSLFAVSSALPEFGRSDPELARYVSLLKMAPYLALPLIVLGLEARAVALTGRPAVTDRVSSWVFRKRTALLAVGTLLTVLAVIADVYRVNATDFQLRAGQRLRMAGRPSEAMAAYARAVRLSPERWDAHFGFGCAAEAAGDAQVASEHYFRALDRNPQAVSALNNLGVLFVRQGKLEAAIAAWEEVVRIVPYDQVGRVNLGHALASLGRADDAALQFRTALVIDPQNGEAKAGLTKLGLAE